MLSYGSILLGWTGHGQRWGDNSANLHNKWRPLSGGQKCTRGIKRKEHCHQGKARECPESKGINQPNTVVRF